MKLRHFFLPHPETHQKAHLISLPAIIIYLLAFILLQTSFSIYSNFKPGVLGVFSNVDQHQLIELTNKEREKLGLPDLKENSELDAAAAAKASNMFQENYWAHYSPSGKDPWGFIKGAGYSFSYAGENLARSFYDSPDVVSAWMASPTHRANIVNTHYQDIGIAVVDGVLQGQKTTLVVQEFGAPVEAVAQAPSLGPSSLAENFPVENSQVNVAGQEQIKGGAVVDPYQITKVFGLSLISLFIILLLLDMYIIRRRAVARVASRHLPHLGMMSVAGMALINMHPGGIL